MAKQTPRKKDVESVPNAVRPSEQTITAIYSKTSVTFSGPLPHPDILREYEALCPGSARKIINHAIGQSSHRMESEKAYILSQIRKELRGQWMAFVLVIVLISAAVFVTIQGHPWVGGVISGTTIVSIVSVFVLGKNTMSTELQRKKMIDQELLEGSRGIAPGTKEAPI